MPIYRADEIAKLLEGRKTILNVGPPFSGKTRSLWTLVAYLKEKNLGPLHIIDLDQKVESLIVALREEPEALRLDLINYIAVHRLAAKDRVESGARKVDNNKEPFLDFQKQFNSFHDQIDINTGQWKAGFECGAVFIDSLSKYNEICQEYIAAEVGHDFGAKETDARNDYSKLMNKVRQTVESLKSLPCITGWLAHDQLVQSEVDGKIVLLPNVAGKNTLAPSLAKEFNVVVFSTRQEEKGKDSKYMWQVRPEGWVRSAGVTSKSNLPTFVEQDYRKIL